MEKRAGNGGSRITIYLIMLFAFILMMQFTRTAALRQTQPYTLGAYEQELDGKKITSVEIVPGKVSPTGHAIVTRQDGSVSTLYATDITKVEDLAREHGLDPAVDRVPEQSWLLTSVLPIVLVAGICKIGRAHV